MVLQNCIPIRVFLHIKQPSKSAAEEKNKNNKKEKSAIPIGDPIGGRDATIISGTIPKVGKSYYMY